ncbi:MAG: hypothetical protein PHW00_06305 [Clostridia bacterium]|nr:hypothetical protein [Clostridia bacterium]
MKQELTIEYNGNIYLQVGYTAIRNDGKIVYTRIPIFVCLTTIEKDYLEESADILEKLKNNINRTYSFQLKQLEEDNFIFNELEEGQVLSDSKDLHRKLIFETIAYYSPRDEKGNFISTIKLYYPILISPKEQMSKGNKELVTNISNVLCSHYEKELFEFINNKKTKRKIHNNSLPNILPFRSGLS